MNVQRENKAKKELFITPDGYFENFHDKLMKSLPQTLLHSNKGYYFGKIRYAAALILLFLICGSIYYNDINRQAFLYSEQYNNEYIDELLDNYSIDDYTLYNYLTEANI